MNSVNCDVSLSDVSRLGPSLRNERHIVAQENVYTYEGPAG